MKMTFRGVIASLTILGLNFVNADAQVLPIGNVKSVVVNNQKVNLTTDHAQTEITVYSANVMRVRIDKSLKKDFSYAVISQPKTTKVNISQTDDLVIIQTDSLKAVIQKKPYAISFQTLDGRIINQDEADLTTSWVGEEVTTYKKMQEGERFIGLGEKTGNLDRKGNGYTNWNTDAFGYRTDQDPIYSTIPFYIGIHNNLNYGIFLDNTYQSDFNFGASNNRFSSFGAQGGEMNYYFIYHKNLADIITSYTALTGRMKMPPLWSLGYQQNRYSYYPDTEVYRIAQTLREKKIPADGITLDIHYMDNYKLFTWDKQRFANPLEMTKKLSSMGFKTTVIVDPGIKVEKNYGAYERGLTDNIFIKYPDSTNYSGQVWPGWCHFPDFTSDKARNWWKKEVKFFAETGVSGIWNDMNEIATWGQKMPSNVLFDYDGMKASHKQAHNVYGMQMARASFEGITEQVPNKRPFILTRAGYAGMQRYTAKWTGDNRSEDNHMLLGVRLMNSLGLSGVAFTGMDIGGFTGNPTVGLYARWIQIGAFNPYFRNHTAVNTKSSEPWSYGEEVLEISRNYISLRYKMLPYLYSAFYEASTSGQPIMRSLAIDYTHDAKVYDTQFQNQFFFGKAIMVAPFESTDKYGKVYFPKATWYNLYTADKEQGNQEKIIQLNMHKLPVYVKESSIIPMQSLIQTTAEKPTDTLTIHVYKGELNNNYVYYEDDGDSYNYEKGEFFKRVILYSPSTKSLVFDKVEGNYKSKFNYIKVVFTGFDDLKALKNAGKSINTKNEFVSLLTPISRFDPQGNNNPAEGYQAKSLIIKNDTDKISLSW
ncbi:alpha-xylosidase BoGH31A [Pedobacter glucosidilyticus]|nr:TIM-barrel domain-containing protein [Pedobacter glucosidilyticus]KHJ39020.1 alpha-xylosidase BoGH31A [Pedobacter glucosidilyticus]